MPRRTLILLAVFAVVVLGLYLTGAIAGAGKPGPVSCGGGGLLEPQHVAPRGLKGIEQCSAGQTLRVAPARLCAISVAKTSSLRPRVLSIDLPAKGLRASIIPSGYPERSIDAELDQGSNDLPLDRAGATIILTCISVSDCVATIK